MPAERCPAGSTGGIALDTLSSMRTATTIITALLLLLAASVGCKEEAPANNPGEFGDPCVDGASVGTPDGCVDGLTCWKGYCEEPCVDNDDCQPVDGWKHECVAGQCQIYCDANSACPQTLAAPMECWINGMWCAAKSD